MDEHTRSETLSASIVETLKERIIGWQYPPEHRLTEEALCREFGVSPRAIRFYEDKGLLAPRRVNGTRVYTRRDRARLSLILRAKAIGSSLAEIKHYLDLYGAHGEGRAAQLRYVLDRTGKAIAELEQKRAHIDASLAELRLIHASARKSLGAKSS